MRYPKHLYLQGLCPDQDRFFTWDAKLDIHLDMPIPIKLARCLGDAENFSYALEL